MLALVGAGAYVAVGGLLVVAGSPVIALVLTGSITMRCDRRPFASRRRLERELR